MCADMSLSAHVCPSVLGPSLCLKFSMLHSSESKVPEFSTTGEIMFLSKKASDNEKDETEQRECLLKSGLPVNHQNIH